MYPEKKKKKKKERAKNIIEDNDIRGVRVWSEMWDPVDGMQMHMYMRRTFWVYLLNATIVVTTLRSPRG